MSEHNEYAWERAAEYIDDHVTEHSAGHVHEHFRGIFPDVYESGVRADVVRLLNELKSDIRELKTEISFLKAAGSCPAADYSAV